MINSDFIIVGSGLTGSTIARILTDYGQQVTILERKDHIAGNVFDYKHESGAMVHHYGPHYFRCGSEKIWNFLNRFTSFYNWAAVLKSKVESEYLSWPVNEAFINARVGEDWNLFQGTPSNFEEVCLSRMPAAIYEMFIKGYTEKQWGVRATELSKDLATRITINKGTVNTLTPNHRWNALPANGYTEMVKGIIGDIPVHLNFDYLQNRDQVKANKLLIFTGPVDEFFDFKFGKLKYRGQNRRIEYLPETDQVQPCIQVNYSNPDDPRIRTIEWKHLMPEEVKPTIKGTVLTHETPFTPQESGQYEYPFPDKENADLYQKYKAEAESLTDTLICGRLGEYRYYDMDQAIGRAMSLTGKLLERFKLGNEEEMAI